MALSHVVSEIFSVEKYQDLEIPIQRPLKIIESGTIRYTEHGVLLMFTSNFVPKTHRFGDIPLVTAQ